MVGVYPVSRNSGGTDQWIDVGERVEKLILHSVLHTLRKATYIPGSTIPLLGGIDCLCGAPDIALTAAVA